MIPILSVIVLASALDPVAHPATSTQDASAPASCAAPAFFPFAAPPGAVGDPVIADLNLDGNPDLVVVVAPDNVARVWLGDGQGAMTAAGAPVSVGAFANSVARARLSGDFNADGKVDVAVMVEAPNSGVRNMVLLFGDGIGGLTPGPPIALPTGSVGDGVTRVASADFNLDGKPDIAVAYPGSQTSRVAVLLGDAVGGLTLSGAPILTAAYAAIGTGDFNGDGKPDLVTNTVYEANELATYFGDGNGSFTKGPVSSAAAQAIPGVSVADFNSDGKLDVAGLSYY